MPEVILLCTGQSKDLNSDKLALNYVFLNFHTRLFSRESIAWKERSPRLVPSGIPMVISEWRTHIPQHQTEKKTVQIQRKGREGEKTNKQTKPAGG